MLTGYLRACDEHGAVPGEHRRALVDAGCTQVVEEQAAGEDGAAQPELDGLLGRLQPGDVVVVPRLHDLALTLPGLAGTLRRIAAAGASLRSLAEAVDAGASQGASPQEAAPALGRSDLHGGSVLPCRIQAGQPATPAPIRRRRGGRPPKLSAQQQGAVLDEVLSGRYAAADMARRYKVSEATISRLLSAYRAYGSTPAVHRQNVMEQTASGRIAGVLPSAALDERLAIVGTSGSGKTYAAKGLVERVLAGGAPVCVVDPLGVWWGLRYGADGTGSAPPFPVVVFGGPHGHVPLESGMAAALGRLVGTQPMASVVDLSGLGGMAARRSFMAAFTAALHEANTRPLHLVLDEADLWAPQRAQAGGRELLGRVEEIVRRGRIRGFVPWLITQRPAVLHKDVLSQADVLISMKLTSSQDRDAVGRWIEGQADRRDGQRILAALPRLAVGEGYVWAPVHGALARVGFPRIRTLDSSSTPQQTESEGAGPRTLATVDLQAIRAALEDRLAT